MKKMSFSMCLFMAIGSIVGAGIFARTPLVIRLVGDGLVWGFLLAAFFVFMKTIPEVILSSALPATGASYMHLTRLMHPSLGAVHAFNQVVLGTMNVAVMSLTFATYFVMLFPSVSPVVIGVAVAIVFTIISTFGVRVSGWVQNIAVVILLIALAIFIFGGLPSVSISLADVIAPTVKITRLWAAMGLLHGSLIGANVLMYAADEIENPGRTIPITFVISTLICAVIFALMGFVSIGNIPVTEWADRSINLATVAGKYLSPNLLVFFIIGGPLLAVSTSINAMILMFSRAHFVAARDGLFPIALSRVNKYGAPANAIYFNTVIGILAMIAGLNLDDILLIIAVPGLLIMPVIFSSIFMLPKKFPNCYKTSFLKIPHWINQIIVVASSILAWLLGSSVLSKMNFNTWIAMVTFYAIALIYTIVRWQYLKKCKGIDIFQKMREPYAPWIEREKNAIKQINEESASI